MSNSVKIQSSPTPQPGQKNRSSENFGTNTVNSGDGDLLWSCPDGVSFNVMKDKSVAVDPVVFKSVKNGTVTKNSDDRNLYIANPKGASEAFTVTATFTTK
ncbi:MAG: DeoR family transcriptional regulator [bacterium]|nr:DeoR family transcriptional regulator [bacterium]